MTHNSVAKQSFSAAHQRGLTLVEVMVALTLSIVLLGSVIQIYLSSKQTYRMDDSLSRLQEAGRIAMDVLTYDLRMAGYQGCADPVTVPTTVMTALLNSDVAPPIQITNLFPNAISGTNGNDGTSFDRITLRYGDPLTAQPIGAASTNSTIAIASNPDGFTANDFFLVSDCTTADIFRATAVAAGTPVTIFHDNPPNTGPTATPGKTKGYTPDSPAPVPPAKGNNVVMRFVANTYTVGDTGRRNERGAPIRALFRTDVNGTQTEIVDGVEYLQVTYCERLTNDNLRCVPANDASLIMSRVVSVRLGLLMVSDDAVLDADDEREYQLADVTIKPGAAAAAEYNKSDRRMRRVFTTTVRLRNRR